MEDWFSGKIAIVTGGGSGIGRGISLSLAEAGTSVVIADVNEEAAARVAAELEAKGASGVAVRTDVSKAADAESMVQSALGRFGRLDFLVNCAGNSALAPVAEMSLETWQSVIDVHLKGTFLCCRAAFDAIVEARGRIVNLSSTYAFKGRPGGANYSAAKAGIYILTKVLATELAPHANVNALAPGPIDTPRWRGGLGDEEYQAKKAERIKDIPLGRMGQPEDIADATLFLLGPGGRWITGSVLNISGGEFMQ